MKSIVDSFPRSRTLSYLAAAIFALVATCARATDWIGADGNEYTALKSIKGTRTASGSTSAGAWIVTDITPSGTDIVKTKFKMNSVSFNQCMWCARTKNSGTDNKSFCGFLIYKTKDNQVLRFDRNGTGNEISGSNPGTSSDCTVVANYSTRKVSINGGTETTFGATGTYTVGSVLMLFGSNDGSNVISDSLESSKVAHKGSYTLYYFQLYTSAGVLKHNLVPAKNASGKAGVYDTVTGKFYPQASNSDSDFTQTARTATGQGRKWTGRGDDNLMSNPANWEGNTLPAADEDLDLTLAPPLAAIVADLDVPHVAWLAGENQPTFTGNSALTKYPVSRSSEWVVDNEKIVVDGAVIKAGGVVKIGSAAGKKGEIEVNSGSVECTDTLYVGYSGNGTLTINGGTVEVASSKSTNPGWNSGSSGTINLNGGILKTQRIAHNNVVSTINFNGGTLQANAVHATDFIKDGMVVNVGAGGGVIDCGGYAIKINTKLNGTGGLLFTGGDRIDIGNYVVNYPGATSVAPGTTLAVNQYAAANNILNHGLVIPGVPTAGQTVFIVTRGEGYTFETSTSAWVKGKRPVCPIAPEAEFEVVDTSNIVVKAVGDLLPGWYIGPANGNLSDPANWSDNVVPTSGNATISCASNATLTVGDTFAPSSITFAPGSAPVTVNGRDLTGIVAVTNLSFVSHTMNAKVYFAGDIQVSQPATGNVDDLVKPHVTFAGGAYAADGFALESGGTQVYSRCVFGEYFLANDAAHPWTASESSGTTRVALGEKAVLHVPYGSNIGTIYVSTGAKVEAGAVTLNNSRVAYRNNGEIVIDSLEITGSADVCVTHGQASSSSVFKFASVTNSLSEAYRFRLQDANNDASHVFYIGKDGLNFSGATGQYVIGRDSTGNYETIRPWNDDFTIAGKGNNVGIYLLGNIEFCTDDENGIGRTITLDAKTVVRAKSKYTISGKGTLKVNNTYVQDDSGALKVITLKDKATLEYTTATATLGTGTITLGAGTTFAFQNTGRELTLPSSIALPSTGTATLRIDGAILHSGKHTILESGATDASTNSLTVTGTAIGSRKTSLGAEGGKLILNIKPQGMMIFVM